MPWLYWSVFDRRKGNQWSRSISMFQQAPTQTLRTLIISSNLCRSEGPSHFFQGRADSFHSFTLCRVCSFNPLIWSAGVYFPLIMAKPWLAIYFMPLMVLIPIGLMNLAPWQRLRANKWPGCSCIFSIRKIFEEGLSFVSDNAIPHWFPMGSRFLLRRPGACMQWGAILLDFPRHPVFDRSYRCSVDFVGRLKICYTDM